MSNRTLKRFRIDDIQGPVPTGRLKQFHDYFLKLDLDPGEPYLKEEGHVTIRFSETQSWAPTTGNRDKAIGRVAYYTIEKLKTILGLPGAQTDHVFQPTQMEVDDLSKIDPNRVAINEWNVIEDQVDLHKNRVFISCGQRSQDEVSLGQVIAQLIDENAGLEGYFAKDQQSLDGVTRNIFQSIYNSAAFIAVMHRRDRLPIGEEVYRGSVWVEQEIAIAAFLVQVLGVQMPNRVFIQSGVQREGIRGFIMLNEIEFDSNDEVVKNITAWLPTLESEVSTS